MKNFKKFMFVFLLGICSVLGIQNVNASVDNYFSIDQTLTPVCNPANISPGGTTNCYLIARPDIHGDAASASVHGFISASFVTKDLKITGADTNPSITGTGTAFANSNTVNGSDTLNSSDPKMPAAIKSIHCTEDPEWIDHALSQPGVGATGESKSDYACAAFYSQTGAGEKFTPSSLRSNADLQKNVVKTLDQYGVIGSYTVKLNDTNTNVNDCGHFCVKAWTVVTEDRYATYKDDDYSGQPPGAACVELHRKGGSTTINPGHSPETGAFTSYVVLIAGALIAIGAIAIAKKNNRFNKI